MNAIVPCRLPIAGAADILDMRQLGIDILETVLNALTIGVVLTDDKANILYANDAAAAMLRAGEPIRSNGRLLATLSCAATTALRRAITQSARQDAGAACGNSIAAPHADGQALIHVVPLRKEPSGSLGRSHCAAVFVAGSFEAGQAPADVLASVYRLTPAETRILLRIAQGDTTAEIARSTGIAMNTVRTHLLRLFAKTGARRQAELVKLVRQFALQLRSVAAEQDGRWTSPADLPT